jgi:hypothetical protein
MRLPNMKGFAALNPGMVKTLTEFISTFILQNLLKTKYEANEFPPAKEPVPAFQLFMFKRQE